MVTIMEHVITHFQEIAPRAFAALPILALAFGLGGTSLIVLSQFLFRRAMKRLERLELEDRSPDPVRHMIRDAKGLGNSGIVMNIVGLALFVAWLRMHH